MSGQEIDRHALWLRLDGVLSYESPLLEAADLAAALQMAAEAEENESVAGGARGMSRIAARTAALLREAKADLETLRSEFANTAA